MPSTTTFIIIVKLIEEVQIEKGFFPPNPLFPDQPKSIEQIKISPLIRIKSPVIIVPNGQLKKCEIIPVTGSMVIHGQNIRRELSNGR